MKFNDNYNLREQIIFKESYDEQNYKYGGIRQFENITVDDLQKLIDNRFIDPKDRQNDSPSVRQMLNYGKKHENVTFNGYSVSPKRGDCRVSIDAIHQEFVNDNDSVDFSNNFGYADEFTVNKKNGRAWFD